MRAPDRAVKILRQLYGKDHPKVAKILRERMCALYTQTYTYSHMHTYILYMFTHNLFYTLLQAEPMFI